MSFPSAVEPFDDDTSAVLFNERRYDRTSLDDIARALSITKPSLYYHFSNKEDILLACLDTAYQHFSEEMSLRDDLAKNGRERMVIMLRLYPEIMAHAPVAAGAISFALTDGHTAIAIGKPISDALAGTWLRDFPSTPS